MRALVILLGFVVAPLHLGGADLLVKDVTRITPLHATDVAGEDEGGHFGGVKDGSARGEDGGVGEGGRGETEAVEGLLDGAECLENLEK